MVNHKRVDRAIGSEGDMAMTAAEVSILAEGYGMPTK
jgi:hypothetical protein